MTDVLNENIDALIQAGLTKMQARVYLGILSLDGSDVQTLSKMTKIDRSNVYKTLKELEKLELIEKYVDTTTVYKPIALPTAISILLSRKKQEYFKVQKGLEQLAQERDNLRDHEIVGRGDYFKILPAGSEAFCRNWEKTLKKIKYSVDLIVTEKREIKDDPIWEIYDDLLKRGVKVRWNIDRSGKNDQEFMLRIKQFEHLFKYPNLEVRFCFDCLKPYGGIWDNDFNLIFLDEGSPLKCTRSLWTNNNQILLNFRQHFEECWKKGIPYH